MRYRLHRLYITLKTIDVFDNILLIGMSASYGIEPVSTETKIHFTDLKSFENTKNKILSYLGLKHNFKISFV